MYKTVEEDTGDMDEETLDQALVQECWPGDSLATASGEDLAMVLGLEVGLEVLAMDMVVLVMAVAITTSRTPQRRIQQ